MKLCLSACLLVGLLSYPVAAQEEEAQQMDTVLVTAEGEEGTAEEGYRVDAIGYGVSGFNQLDKLDTPYSVSSFSQDLIKNQNIESIADLARYDASVKSSFSSPGYYSAVSIRGFDLNNWSNYRYNGLMIVNQASTALENKERIDILKGLSALQAGFAAPGGIVNYVTKRPGEEDITDLHLSLNDHGNKVSHIDYSRAVSDDFGLRINLAAEDIETYVDDVDGERFFGSVAADWDIADDTRLALDVERQHRDSNQQGGIIGNNFIPAIPDPSISQTQDWSYYDTETSTVGGKLTHDLNADWAVILEANHMHLRRDNKVTYLDNLQPNGDVDVYGYFSDDETRIASNGRASINGRFATGPVAHNLAVGASTYYQKNRFGDGYYDVIGTSNIYNPSVVAIPSGTADNLPPSYTTSKLREQGLFANDVISPVKWLDVHVGGRYADVNYNFGDENYNKGVFSPSGALVFKPLEGLSLYTSYIEGLEQGGTAPATAVNANAQLNPLENTQIEVGVKADVLDYLFVQAAVFEIERAAEYLNSANVYVQDGEQVHRGFELSATGKITPEWTVIASTLLLDAELKNTGDPTTDGNQPTNVPETNFTTFAEYAPLALPGWAFSGNWQYTGSKYFDGANSLKIKSYHLFGAGVRYATELYGTPTTWRLNVENITDKRYYEDVAYGYLETGAPRTIWLSASFAF